MKYRGSRVKTKCKSKHEQHVQTLETVLKSGVKVERSCRKNKFIARFVECLFTQLTASRSGWDNCRLCNIATADPQPQEHTQEKKLHCNNE